MRQHLAAQQTVATKYYQAINFAMSMERTTEIDDTTINLQWTAFKANQSQQFATMNCWLEQCMLANGTGTPPPPIIDTSWKQRKGPLSDGPEGVTKTEKCYKNCDNACWSHSYDCSKKHHNGNCTHEKDGHIDSHTGDNLAHAKRTRSFCNGPDGVGGCSWIVT